MTTTCKSKSSRSTLIIVIMTIVGNKQTNKNLREPEGKSSRSGHYRGRQEMRGRHTKAGKESVKFFKNIFNDCKIVLNYYEYFE